MKHPKWMTRNDGLPVAHVWPHHSVLLKASCTKMHTYAALPNCFTDDITEIADFSKEKKCHFSDNNPAPAGDGRPMCPECLRVQERLEREWEAKYGKWERER